MIEGEVFERYTGRVPLNIQVDASPNGERDMHDARFAAAVETVLKHEGGFVDHAADPGGATNWGVSIRYLRGEKPAMFAGITLDQDGDGDLDAEDIRLMPRETAIEIYRRGWWDRYGYGDLPCGVGEKVFDTSINTGPGRAHRLLQEALRTLGHPVSIDGVIGPKTRDAARNANPTSLLRAYRQHQALFYQALAIANPRLRVFLVGWQRRAAS